MGFSALPFRVQLVVFFFLFDAAERVWQLGGLLIGSPERPAGMGLIDLAFPVVLTLLFDLLLAGMIAFRTRSGRFWGIIYLCSLSFVGLTVLVLEPTRWVELGRQGRVIELLTHAINLGLAAILLSPTARRVLDR